MGFVDYVQAIIDGVLFGTTYSLIGIGFTLVFGVMHKINMSFAAASLAGAYCGLIGPKLLGLPLWTVFPVSVLAAGAIGYLIYLACFRFIPLASPLATLMSTVGMLLLVDEIVVHETDGMPQNYPPIYTGDPVELGPFVLRADYLGVFLVCVVAMAVLLTLLYRTRLGMATRAVAQQPVAAQLCGMRLQSVNGLTFVISGLLGGVAGTMIGASTEMLSPLISGTITVKGLIVTVIGGLGSIPGAIVAGLLVGAAENLFQAMRNVTERDIYVMLLLFVFLVLRPNGLFAAARGRD
jgi:branched-chain amino acid transport system permease protein